MLATVSFISKNPGNHLSAQQEYKWVSGGICHSAWTHSVTPNSIDDTETDKISLKKQIPQGMTRKHVLELHVDQVKLYTEASQVSVPLVGEDQVDTYQLLWCSLFSYWVVSL